MRLKNGGKTKKLALYLSLSQHEGRTYYGCIMDGVDTPHASTHHTRHLARTTLVVGTRTGSPAAPRCHPAFMSDARTQHVSTAAGPNASVGHTGSLACTWLVGRAEAGHEIPGFLLLVRRRKSQFIGARSTGLAVGSWGIQIQRQPFLLLRQQPNLLVLLQQSRLGFLCLQVLLYALHARDSARSPVHEVRERAEDVWEGTEKDSEVFSAAAP